MPTPNLDQLASEELVLTQFFVEPGCAPSWAGLMTGRYSVRSGLNSIIVAGTPLTLRDEEFTLAELFTKNGYHTGMTGKWHLGQEEQSLPINQGFDTYKLGFLRQLMERSIPNQCGVPVCLRRPFRKRNRTSSIQTRLAV